MRSPKIVIGIGIAILLIPLSAFAQVFGQNQIILSPFGSNGFVVSTTTANGAKLSASSTPYFANFFAGNGTIKNASTSLESIATTLWITPIVSKILKTDSSGKVSGATAGSDYVNGSGTSGNCVQWGASNALADAGSACGSGSLSGTGFAGMLTAWTSASALTATSTPTAAAYLATSTTATSTFRGNVMIGTSANNAFLFDNTPLQVSGNVNNFLQAVIQNTNAGASASSDLILNNDKSTNTTYYTDLGINSSGNVEAGYNAINPGDSYLIASDGSLVLAAASTTNTNAAVQIATNGTASSSILATFTQSGRVGIGSTSPYSMLSIHHRNGATFTNILAIASSTLTATTTLLSLDNTGSLGLGTTSPFGLLAINASSTYNQFTAPWFTIGSTTGTLFMVGNNGRVGIGTSSPNAALSVNLASTTGATPALIIASTSNNGAYKEFLRIDNIGTTTWTGYANQQVLYVNSSGVQLGTTTLAATAGGTGNATFAANGVVYGNAGGNLLVTAQGGTNTILVASAGAPSFSATPTINTSLAVPLIQGNNAVTGTLNIRSTAAAGTSDKILFTVHNAGNKDAGRITTDGLWGIGTSSPWGLVSIASTTPSVPLFAVGIGGLAPATTTAFIIDSLGRVGVGTSSPQSYFGIEASSTALGSTAPFFSVGSTTSSLFIINNNGAVGVGNDTSADYRLEVVGSLTNGYFGVTNTTDGDIFNIASSKNVGIGSTSPWALLSINPDIGIGAAPIFAIGSSTKTQFLIDNVGRLAISTTTFNADAGLTVGTTTVFQVASYGGNISSSTDSSAAQTIVWNTGNTKRLILNQNTTIAINATSSKPVDGFLYKLIICQDGTGSRTLTYSTPGQLVWMGGNHSTTTIASGANDATTIGMLYDGRTQRYQMLASSTTSGDPRACVP